MVKDEKEAEGKQRSERVGFSHYLMFREVLRDDEELCRLFLERVLGFPIERVEEKHFEYPLDPMVRSRGARFDLYLKDSNRVIDVEMQSSPAPGLGRRLRYYQGVLDVSLLPRSVKFRALPESYIVFICKDDPFGRGIPRYTIEPVCREEGGVELACDLHWLVLNASAFELEEEPSLRNLLSYVKDGTVDATDPLVVGIDAKVDELNGSDEVMAMIWTVEDEIELREDLAAERAFAEGEVQGRAEGRAEGEAHLSKLINMLLESDRIEDAKRATTDEPYRESLFKELGIA